MGPVRGGRVWRLYVADQEGAVTRVFGERMRAGWVGAGEVRMDVGDRLFQKMLGDVAGQWEAWWQNGRLRPW